MGTRGDTASKAMGKLRGQLNAIPRCSLCHLPTPLEKLESLSRKLGLNVYIKRDDETGLAMGGNKSRKLEFIMADALAQGAKSIVTWAGMQSNWCRQAAAAARRVGIQPFLVLFRRLGLPAALDGNVLLDEIYAADVTIVDLPKGALIDKLEQVDQFVGPVAYRAREEGKKPYIAPIGGSIPEGSMRRPLGAFGYVDAMLELAEQAEQRQLAFDYLICATGSGGTHAGLAAGKKLLSLDTRIVGISVCDKREEIVAAVAKIATQTMEEFTRGHASSPIPAEEVIAFDSYIGAGYGLLNQNAVEAIGNLAEEEGILLDPVYTGKAMAGFLDLAKSGYFERGSNIVFVHTGGTPALFPYRDGILEYLRQVRTGPNLSFGSVTRR
jgi:D-cysteine desulfhydrase family pyridoxal phosphate-dependent enzyme